MRYKIKNIREQKGFTIVEALIVLAVTGMLFVSTSFLIRGQIEKVRYQDSMRQLQQMVQNTIDDVENGYLTGNTGTSSTTLLVGKRFWFCADGYTIPTSPPTVCGSDGGSIMTTETVTKNGATLSYENPSAVNLPGGLKFRYFKSLDVNGQAPSGEGSKEFGAQASFTDSAGNIGAENATMIALFNRPAAYQLGKDNSPGNNDNIYGRILCFQGYRMGSLELGSAQSGTRVLLNTEDSRCN
ncbi:MAG: type II secretion system GspH family protein [Chitinophagaceae bacterium]|nr:type II secretion system GspH family protein [Chitinophagaceae bacterium]